MTVANVCPRCSTEIGVTTRYVVDGAELFHIGCYGIHPEIVDPRPSLIYLSTDGTRYMLDRMPASSEVTTLVDERMPRRDWEILAALWRTFTNGDPLRRWGP